VQPQGTVPGWRPTVRPTARLDCRTFSSESLAVAGNEFLCRLRALGKRTGLPVALDAARGKDSHQTVYFGSSYTILRNPKDELKTGT